MREFGAPLRICLPVWPVVTLRAATGRVTELRSILLIACTSILMAITCCLPASAATRHIVLLFDERVELPGLSLLEAEFVHTLRSSSAEPVEIYREAMDLSRFSSNSYKVLLQEFLRAKYADKKIDVAVAIMVPAFDFLMTYGDLLFPGTPIVFCGMDRRQLGNRSLPPNIYGVLIKREFAPTLDLVLRLHPATERVVVISGTSDFDQELLSQAKNDFRPYENRISFTYLSDLSLEQLLPKLSQLPSRDIVLIITVFQDGSGQPFVPHEVVERVSGAASVPLYGFLDQYIGRGIIGGSLYSIGEHGAKTARMALQLLTGAATPEHLSEVSSNKTIFDWRQMQRWGISEAELPAGSQIYFRELPAWQKYSWEIALVSAIVLIQAALISILLQEHRRRRTAEVQSRQRMAELAHINRFSTAGELTASIAHEINQPLGSILTNAETAQSILASKDPDIDELNNIVSDIVQDDRRASEVIRRLRSLLKRAPFEPKSIDLNELVRETVEFLSALAIGREVKLNSIISPIALPIVGDRIQLQQVILNLVVNAIDAMADTPSDDRVISIRTSRVENFAELAISDHGPGIPEDKLKEVFEPFVTNKPKGMGMGLSIARTIVEAHDGQISASNEPGRVFRIKLPISRHASAG
ncbi:GHKL domain-containing protein [Bradyrhizobium sp. CSA112]|uniref:sensor histidine kinase n=1 Tax=Bradyrhizobium sp. CSA112 TaxID=2699170 RepID=UPI0023B1C567|nr:HAMP domain-containing sensor histidine kinase [Bradyrhizobium sp. CSA112]MDE5455432.1 GHKL domain-containing protein [Bradyrhizobium sp. CSA112]